jgi:STE24 endopeptidase
MRPRSAINNLSRHKWVRVGATAVAAVAVAEIAAWALRPREVVEPVQAEEGAYFSDAQLEEARDYRSGQRLLMVGGLVAGGGVMVLLVSGRPRWARRALERAGARPVVGGAAAAAGLFVAVEAAGLPFSIAAHERAVDVGLSTQSLGEWGVDVAKSTAIGTALAAAVGTAALALMRRYRDRWWIPGSVAFVALAAAFTWVAPVVLAPLFNDFDPLERGQARADVLELADRAGVDVGEVYRVDASRQTTGINAYVGGLGPTKRVVLYDNLLDDLDRDERRSVIAHELSHAESSDIPRGLLWLALATPLALLLSWRLAGAFDRRSIEEPGAPASLPALALALTIVSFGVGVVGNQLSRRVEARADTRAMELTDDPAALIRLQQQLAASNISDPDPPDAYTFLFGTHPTAMERIGAALAYADEHQLPPPETPPR